MIDCKKPLLIIAHPDDEVICFWWAIQNYKPDILCCTSDANNPERAKWSRRKEGLHNLCSWLGLQYRCLDYPSRFCRIDDRGRKFASIEREIVSAGAEMGEHDVVFTHNPWGEYGHMDHIYVYSFTVRQYGNLPIYMSDIFIKFDGMWADAVNKYKPVTIEFYNNNIKHYCKAAAHYGNIRMWTWGCDRAESCSIWKI